MSGNEMCGSVAVPIPSCINDNKRLHTNKRKSLMVGTVT